MDYETIIQDAMSYANKLNARGWSKLDAIVAMGIFIQDGPRWDYEVFVGYIRVGGTPDLREAMKWANEESGYSQEPIMIYYKHLDELVRFTL